MELGILHNGPPSTRRSCRVGRLHRLWHGLPPAPWPCTRSQHHSVPSRNLHPLMVPPFLQPHPDLQSAVGNAPLSSKHPAQLPTTDCLLSIISPMGGQPSDAPALSPPSPLQQGDQSSNASALSPPSPLPQGGQPIALALSPPSPPPQGGQPSDAPGLSLSSSTLLLCPSDSTLSICHLNSQSAVKTGCMLGMTHAFLTLKQLEMLTRRITARGLPPPPPPAFAAGPPTSAVPALAALPPVAPSPSTPTPTPVRQPAAIQPLPSTSGMPGISVMLPGIPTTSSIPLVQASFGYGPFKMTYSSRNTLKVCDILCYCSTPWTVISSVTAPLHGL
ncbi:hypothetical protein ACOMHN_000709 [Nucella lapillus]